MPDNLSYPYGVPSVSGDTVTVDWLLQEPRRITNTIARLSLQRFFVDRIFSPAGDITGGAVAYEQATANDLYATRDVSRVEPGDEFPVVTFERGAVLTAQVEKYGGKFFVTDEARRRNKLGRVNRAITQLANTIQRKTQQRAISELTAAITANSRTAAGTSWGDAAATVAASQVATIGILADLTQIQKQNFETELGYEYNFAIMNPQEWRNGRLAVGGNAADFRALLADSGINGVWVTNRIAAGTVYWLAEGQVGELGYEVPLSTETWRDGDGRQQDWYQTYVLPIVYVTDPFAIFATTGHNA
jgi:hypothetical protein